MTSYIKDKISHIVNEQSELFPQINDDTIERLDHLISIIRNQTKQINILEWANEHLFLTLGEQMSTAVCAKV